MSQSADDQAAEGTFRLMVARAGAGAPVGYAIIAVGTMDDGELHFAEVFAVIRSSDAEPALSQMRFTLPRGTCDRAETEARLVEYAQQQLLAKLDEQFLRWRASAQERYSIPYVLEEKDAGTFGLWLREVFGRQALDAIRRRTACRSLERYLARTLRLGDVLSEPFER